MIREYAGKMITVLFGLKTTPPYRLFWLLTNGMWGEGGGGGGGGGGAEGGDLKHISKMQIISRILKIWKHNFLKIALNQEGGGI